MIRHLVTALTCLFLSTAFLHAGRFTLQQDAKGVTVQLDGKLFTRYLIRSGAKPILWPIVGPTGKEMTRGYPMREVIDSEKKDHIHHRSLWFDHGDVNGISYWAEQDEYGTIVHREFLKVADGDTATIKTRNDWVDPDGKKVCEDVRTLVFQADAERRWIDFDVTVKAGNQQIKFGDTKEGSFGLRVAGSMRVQLKTGGKIVNSQGQTDIQAWGKRAAWVDYSGPVDGKRVGIAILNHPSSFRYPTYWHVRTYGLFAANPFGWHNFRNSDKYDGSLTLKPGEAFSLFYRVIFHRGDAEQAHVAEAFRAYSQVSKSGPQPTSP